MEIGNLAGLVEPVMHILHHEPEPLAERNRKIFEARFAAIKSKSEDYDGGGSWMFGLGQIGVRRVEKCTEVVLSQTRDRSIEPEFQLFVSGDHSSGYHNGIHVSLEREFREGNPIFRRGMIFETGELGRVALVSGLTKESLLSGVESTLHQKYADNLKRDLAKYNMGRVIGVGINGVLYFTKDGQPNITFRDARIEPAYQEALNNEILTRFAETEGLTYNELSRLRLTGKLDE